MEWTDGYSWFAGGTFEEQQEGFAGMIRALMVAILGIFAVLVLQFRSFLQPLIVFAAVPLAFVGAVLALLVTGNTFSFTVFIGITSLVGIVINNSIILVDYANRMVAAGDDVDEALRKAGETRFQPIILTTVTTVSGLLPLTLVGSSLWSPLGWTIIGGLLTSTVLTLLLVPALYRVASTVALPEAHPEPEPALASSIARVWELSASTTYGSFAGEKNSSMWASSGKRSPSVKPSPSNARISPCAAMDFPAGHLSGSRSRYIRSLENENIPRLISSD